MTDANIFNQILIWPFINLLIFFYKGFTSLHIPGSLGWAIIAMTITIRAVLHPLTKKQMDSAKQMQKLKPEIDSLQKKFKKDPQKLQQEQMKLYKKYGINPASGCLPLIIQFPILIALYQVFFQLLNNGNINEVVEAINKIVYFPQLKIESLNIWFLGLNLGAKPSQWQEYGIYLLAIPVITALLQWLQTKAMTPAIPPKKETDKKEGKEDMAAEMQKQMSFIMPLMIGFFAYSFPIGLSLYWNTFSIFSIISHRNTK